MQIIQLYNLKLFNSIYMHYIVPNEQLRANSSEGDGAKTPRYISGWGVETMNPLHCPTFFGPSGQTSRIAWTCTGRISLVKTIKTTGFVDVLGYTFMNDCTVITGAPMMDKPANPTRTPNATYSSDQNKYGRQPAVCSVYMQWHLHWKGHKKMKKTKTKEKPIWEICKPMSSALFHPEFFFVNLQ